MKPEVGGLKDRWSVATCPQVGPLLHAVEDPMVSSLRWQGGPALFLIDEVGKIDSVVFATPYIVP